MNIETAKRLFEYRKANGFSQEELAEKIGVSRQAISKWERSESSPDTDNLIALANLYGITIDELLNGTEPPKKAVDHEEQPAEESENENGNDYSETDENKDNKEANINFNNGINFNDGKDKVHVGWDGIHVESKNGDNVHVGGGYGVHVETKDGNVYDNPNPNFYSPKPEKNPWLHAMLPIGMIILYLLLGFTTHRGWAVGWIMFLFIPIIETAVTAFKTKNPAHFAYPVFVVALFLLIGMLFYVWHPTWILFITIPMYYLICDAYKKTRKSKYDDFSQYNSANGTYYSPSGTDTQTRSKGSTVAAIVISIICGLTIIAVVAISCVFGFLGKGLDWAEDYVPSIVGSIDYDDSGSYSIGSNEVPLAGISKISVEWVSGKITVEYYDGETIKFSEPEQSNQDRALRYLVKANELEIKYCKSGLNSWKGTNNNPGKDLTIYLPMDYVAQEIDIESVSSKINVNDITARQIDITTVSGDVTAKGNFTVIDTNGVSGNVDVTTYSVPTKVDAETVSGDYTISVPKDISGFTIDYDSVSGDVIGNDFYIGGGATIEKGKQTYGDGSTKIDFESVSGDFEIKAAS